MRKTLIVCMPLLCFGLSCGKKAIVPNPSATQNASLNPDSVPSSLSYELPATDTSFTSPSDRFVVTFERIEHVTYSNPQNIDEVNHIIYKVKFLEKNIGQQIDASYTDVYDNRKPSEVKYIFNYIVWSPKDDIAILPEEDWAAYPLPKQFTAVNLSKLRQWKTASFYLTTFEWIDSMQALGEYGGDCYSGIDLFNGLTGISREITPPKSSYGYNIDSKTDSGFVIKTTLGNCATEEEREEFVEGKFFLDFKRLTLKPLDDLP